MMFTFAEASNSPHVSLAAEEVFSIFGIPITNAMMLGLLGNIILVAIMFYVARKVSKNKSNVFVGIIRWGFEALYDTIEQVTQNKVVAKRLAPLAITLFFFILIQYWIGILPIVGPITWDGVPLFRSLAADLNTTFALAIITMVMAQVYAIRHLGFFGNLGRYFRNPFKDPAGAFEGVLELIAEFSRMTGLSLRLFGNVFAGEVLLMMIAFLTTWAAPATLPPFMAFELFIGAVQAYIFFMLTVVFISLGISHGEHGSSSEHQEDHADGPATQPVAVRSDG